MKILFSILLILLEIECTDGTIVYICDSTDAKRYHLKENCRGLSGCQHQVIKTTLEKAKNENKTLCSWEQK